MYERFTNNARQAMKLAALEARRFNHEYIGTEHELLGLVKVGKGIAAVVLKNADVPLDQIQREVEKRLTPGPSVVRKKSRRFLWWWVASGRLPQSPNAKKVIEHAMEAARDLSHNYIGTEHLLLGLLREKEGVAAIVLANLGLNFENVREAIVDTVGYGVRD